MRLKIDGEITAERLAQALVAVQKKFESVRPGTRFFGANLYMTAYSVDGEPFDLCDARKEPLIHRFPAKQGEIARPALSAEGQIRRQQRLEDAKEQRRLADEWQRLRDESDAKDHAERLQRQKDRQAARHATDERLNKLAAATKALIEINSDRFISSLNEALQAAWDEVKPVYTRGKNKGLPQPRPTFLSFSGRLYLDSETVQTPYALRNPMLKKSDVMLAPIFSGAAWANAIERMQGILDAAPTDEPGTQALKGCDD